MRLRRRLTPPAALATVALLGAIPASAGTRTCNATLVAQNTCRVTTGEVLYFLPISTVDPDSAGPLLAPSALIVDAFAAQANWTGTAICTNGSGSGPNMVAAGICTQGQVGALVPITKAQNSDLQIREYILSVVRWYRVREAVAAAEAAAKATAAPDVGQ